MDKQRENFILEKLRLMEERCRKNKLSLTAQRRAVMENLASRTDHPTADQIYGAIQGSVKGLSRTTVYRVLETFVQLGLARKISNPEARARFDADTTRHHHAACNNCEEVVDIYSDTLDNLSIPSVVPDFDVLDFSVSFTGLCSKCRDKVKKIDI
jgi:Fur family peroxide stress response transcriptional regulator